MTYGTKNTNIGHSLRVELASLVCETSLLLYKALNKSVLLIIAGNKFYIYLGMKSSNRKGASVRNISNMLTWQLLKKRKNFFFFFFALHKFFFFSVYFYTIVFPTFCIHCHIFNTFLTKGALIYNFTSPLRDCRLFFC